MSPVPHVAIRAAIICSGVEPFGALDHRIRVALEHDQPGVRDGCVAANSAAGATAPSPRRGPLHDYRDRRGLQ